MDAEFAGSGDSIGQNGIVLPKAKAPFVCNICKRTYSRLDHLGRHYRTHTSEKPFTCDQCSKSFARVDLLKRHKSGHDGESTNKTPSRQRVAKACRHCAEAKLRCSDVRPCERCSLKRLTCCTAQLAGGYTDLARGESNASSQELLPSMESPSFETGEQPDHPSLPSLPPMPSDANHSGVQFQDPVVAFQESYDLLRNDGEFDMPYFNHDVDEMAMGSFFGFGSLPDVLDFTFSELLTIPTLPADFEPLPLTRNPSTFIEDDPARSSLVSGTVTPAVRRAVAIGQQAFKDSMWQWTPGKGDHRKAEQIFLTLPNRQAVDEAQTPEARFPCDLSNSSRDRILALILRLTDHDVHRIITRSFPSADQLSMILEKFTSYHAANDQELPWIHLPTVDFNEESEEFLLAMACSGAAHSRSPEIRKLGFAMQESARLASTESFEEDNRNVRDLRTLQAFALQLHVGLWSGIRRKIEISESFALPLITMLRRGGQFRRRTTTTLDPSDEATKDEACWRQWIKAESAKRLVLHCFLEDTRTSMCLLIPPLIPFTELHLELPCSDELWQAASASEWKAIYQAHHSTQDYRMPTIRACLADLNILSRDRSAISIHSSLALVVATIWPRAWHWRQMKTTALISGGDNNMLTVNAYKQDLVTLCKHLALIISDLDEEFDNHTRLTLELCQMHLHVSLEDIQLFAGKDGPEEARKMLASLRSWTGSAESRQALYHGGQVLRAASQLPFGSLRGPSAVGVYHASLTMWAYAVLNVQLSPPSSPVLVRLDVPETQALQRFLMLGKGDPCIQSYTASEMDHHSVTFLADPMETMISITGLLASKHSDDRSTPPFVSNLSKMIHSLKGAAAVLKSSRV